MAQKTIGQDEHWMNHVEDEGQLAVDVYQTEDSIVLVAPIAGVNEANLEVAITDEIISIRGSRSLNEQVPSENYFVQECYWGSFSRSYVLPVAVDPDAASAGLKDGILTIRIPRVEKSKTRILKVTSI
ncbi:MAG TPA: Hsp20/alpha crystallin family protein [Patescibacteria group bacterium]